MIVMKITGLLPESMLQPTTLMLLMLQPTTMIQAEVLVGLEEVEVGLEEAGGAEAAEAAEEAEEAEVQGELLELKQPIQFRSKL